MSLRYKGAVISATPPTTTGGESGVASGSWTLEQQLQAQGAGNWPEPFVAKYIEDVFSTYLYTGNGSTQTITNGIDLSTYGGLVWAKMRSNGSATGHVLSDTARGPSQKLDTSSTGASSNWTPYGISAFGSTGFTVADDGAGNYVTNNSGVNYASWTFRKQPKFFDVVTYTGNGTSQTINHNLGSKPGFIIVKDASFAASWITYHQSLGATQGIILNSTAVAATNSGYWNDTEPTATQFTVGGSSLSNRSGDTLVAYLFAHDAGGFGLTGTDNVISCGSFTNGGSTVDVNLGYEAQFVLMKKSSGTGNWFLFDTMREMSQSGFEFLYPNLSNAAEPKAYQGPYATATGFSFNPVNNGQFTSGTYIYIAIRRGPMKVPTSGTSVFSPVAETPSGSASYVMNSSSGFPVDMLLYKERNNVATPYLTNRLTNNYLQTASTAAEASYTYGYDLMQGVRGQFNATSQVDYAFRRAPSFFDEVCYTGNNVNSRVLTHNLGVAPELVIIKSRTAAFFSGWSVTTSALPVVGGLYQEALLESTGAFNGGGFRVNIPSTGLTTTTVTLGTDYSYGNESPNTYVMYLFATCAGVSKVGSYTGNGTTQTIDCGFTGGARFVLIKRTDSTGDWYVYDTARGMTTLTDPYLLLNSTAAESVTLGSVTTVSTGFAVNASILAAINTNGASYIFLAIA